MTELQQVQLDILKQFLRVCDQLGLRYYLVCGSALGAVKYGGFIPWDDDVDVALPRGDYEIFLKRAHEFLPEHLFLQNYHTDPRFPAIYSKLRNTNTTFLEKTVAHLPIHHGVFIDIFPLDGYPNSYLGAALLELRKMYYRMKLFCVYEGEWGGKAKFLQRVGRFLGWHQHTGKTVAVLDRMLSKYPLEKSALWCNHGNWQGKLEYAPKWQYGAGRTTEFEGLQVCVPERPDEYLQRKYGDYRKDPPEESRKGHHYYEICDCSHPYTVYTQSYKIAFVSNFYNHHQHTVSQALHRLTGGNYRFIATSEMNAERKALGYGQTQLPSYVCLAYQNRENMEEARKWILEADAVIAGSAPEWMLRQRIRAGKLLLRYAERPLKKGDQLPLYLPRFLKWHLRDPAGKPIYMLAASGYTARDYAIFGLFRGKTYRWGYFPEAKQYRDRTLLMEEKDPRKILWCGRFLPWKHPDDAIHAAKMLKDAGCTFSLDMIGAGEMEETLQNMIRDLDLSDTVRILGPMKPEQVRAHMEKTGIFLFTSDRQEGWGAVLNEAMNSGCAVVASHLIGAVPFLMEDGKNGLVYSSGDRKNLFEMVKTLLEDHKYQQTLGLGAYKTVTEIWNGEVAAQRLYHLIGNLLQKEKTMPYESGPCSKIL